MLLSLVSAPVLGFDLTRHPHGDAIAAVLLRALTCGPADLPAYADARQRADRPGLVAARVQARSAVEESLAAPRPALPGASRPSVQQVVDDLAGKMIADLDSVEALVREDVFAWSARRRELPDETVPRAERGPRAQSGPPAEVDPRLARDAADVFVDAIASVWPRDGLNSSARRVLVAAFLEGCRRVPWRDPDIGPNGVEIRIELDRLAALHPSDRDRMRAAVKVLRPTSTTEWAAAMHEASWAAFTTGRVRAAAAAQLLAVRAYSSSGFDAMDGAEGVWNAISGYVQARVLADVLPDELGRRLERTWRVVFADE